MKKVFEGELPDRWILRVAAGGERMVKLVCPALSVYSDLPEYMYTFPL